MLAAWFLPLILHSPIVNRIELARGAAVEGFRLRYWAVEDTTILALAPDQNQGTAYTLEAGPGSAVLIRFGDLDRALGKHSKVTSATLVLNQTSGGTVVAKQIARVLKPWRPGPAMTIDAALRRPSVDTTKPGAKIVGTPHVATWRESSSGDHAWQIPGALGPSDAKNIASASLTAADGQVKIAGLAEAVQDMKDHPFENYGFLIRFEAPCAFVASLSQKARPTLVVEVEDQTPTPGPELAVTLIQSNPERPKTGESVTYTAHVSNVGTVASGPVSGSWLENGRTVNGEVNGNALAPGQEATFTITRTVRPEGTIGFRTNDSGGAELQIPETAAPVHFSLGGKDASWVQDQARLWNEVICPQSRYSFAPQGCLAKVRIQGFDGPKVEDTASAIKAFGGAWGIADSSAYQVTHDRIDLATAKTRSATDRFPGLFSSGDTRFDGPIPGLVPLPAEPVSNPFLDANPMEATDLLSASDVGDLNAAVLGVSGYGLPKTSAIRAVSFGGVPLANTELSFYQSDKGRIPAQVTFKVKTDSLGRAILPSVGGKGPYGDLLADGSNGVFLVSATSDGLTEFAWLKAWQLKNAARRGSSAAASVDIRFNVAGAKIDTNTNLSLDRIVTDSKDDFAAKLNALIDGDDKTEATLPSEIGSWVQVDLGRDRTVGEIRLNTKGSLWPKFDVLVYATGQRPSDAFVWAKEMDWSWTAKNRSDSLDLVSVAYRNTPQRVRFIRIVSREAGPASLTELKIHPVAVLNDN